MATRWVTFDRMLRELGEVRFQVNALSGTPVEAAPEAGNLRVALDHAVGAVHHCLDDEDERTLLAAWQAIAQAQDALRGASAVIATARSARLAAHEARRRAARQREDVRLWRKSHGYAHETPPTDGPPTPPVTSGPSGEDPDGDHDR
jgi:hypothetical protein